MYGNTHMCQRVAMTRFTGPDAATAWMKSPARPSYVLADMRVSANVHACMHTAHTHTAGYPEAVTVNMYLPDCTSLLHTT